MATTTFSGPVKAGTISNTTGTTVGTNMANVGSVLMSQTEKIDQTSTSTTTSMIIPANSQLVSADLYVSVIWSTTTTAGLGYVGDATAFTAATDIAGGTLGIIKITAGANKARVDAWADVGSTDRRILLTNGSTGNGEGWLTVTYIQNVNVG